MKTGFGGTIVHRAHAYDAVLNRPRHVAFRVAEVVRARYLQGGRRGMTRGGQRNAGVA